MKTGKFVFICVMLTCLVFPLFAGGQQSGAASGLSEIGFNAAGYPIVSKPYTFSVSVNKRAFHGVFANMEVSQNMEKKTGVTINWIEVPEASFRERTNLMLASGDLPDVFGDGMQDSDIVRYGPSGTLIPIENYIDRYAPLIKDLFSKRPEVRQYVTAPDAHIYTLPRIQELAHRVNPDNMFINKTWMDKLGLAMPNTYDEFHSVLTAFKERDPNGNGRRDEIPLSFIGSFGVGGTNDISSLFAGFGMHDNGNHIMVSNKKVYYTANTPEFRNALVYFNKLWADGLIDPEAFTHTVSQSISKGMEPDMLYGVFFDWFDEITVGDDRARTNYVVLPPMIGVDGKRHWNMHPNALMGRSGWAVTNKMKNPEVAVRWADACYEWEASMELCYGAFGISLEMRGNQIIMKDPPAGMSIDDVRYLNSPVHNTPYAVYETDHRRMNFGLQHIRKFERLDVYRQYFPPLEDIYPQVFFLSEEESELAIIRTELNDYVNQMRAKFIIGTESISTGWNAYVAAINQIGVNRYLELYQKALDRYYK